MTVLGAAPPPPHGGGWLRHVIDNTSRGADGVRFSDVNHDGFLDITTGWEEGGRIRVYLNPGPLKVKLPWPLVTVGEVASPEDAVFVDLDDDGAIDVVSSCEGADRTVYVHWAPRRSEDYLKADHWHTEPLGSSRGVMRWMFALPFEVDFRNSIDVVAGGRNPDGAIGWFQSPAGPRRTAGWKWWPLRPTGWVMSLIAEDMDRDGDDDVLASDRQGDGRGVFWLENPGPGPRQLSAWPEHTVGNTGEEVMFLTEADIDHDGLTDVVAAVRPKLVCVHRRLDLSGNHWESSCLTLPDWAGTSKAVRVADLDLDGELEIVVSCEHADGPLHGIVMINYDDSSFRVKSVESISGPTGVKFDRMGLLDLDGDQDLDIVTCEERSNLGVIWYENPTR